VNFLLPLRIESYGGGGGILKIFLCYDSSYSKNTIFGNLSGQTEARGKPQYMGIEILERFGLWNLKDDAGKIIDEIYLECSAVGKREGLVGLLRLAYLL
jgi:hypothetical protein